MIRTIILSVCLLAFGSISACDICGGFSLNPQAGSITQVNRHFLSWTYGYVPFAARNLTYSRDLFHNQIIQGQYMISNRWSVGGTFLWSKSYRHSEQSKVEIEGWGNPMAQVFYSPLIRSTKSGTWIWRTGAGLRFPFGSHDENIHDRNIPENFNPSDGAWGFVWQNDMVRVTEAWAFNLSTMNLWRGPSPDQSKLGDQFNVQFSAAYLYQITQRWVVSPLIGLGWEHLTPNRYPTRKEVPQTGGHNSFVHSGLSINHQKGSLSCRYTHPIHNGLNNQNIRPEGRWMIQATVFI